MITIQITFPWGRYYAHPWGINPVRLREAEWPPSPWRLLRALVSAWFRGHPGVVPIRDAVALIDNLGNSLPEIGMGTIAFGHTVHYQPNYGKADASDKVDARYSTARHENHFVAVHGPVFFCWPELDLPLAQAELLSELLSEISYFGRSESICRAELLKETSSRAGVGWCKSISASGARKISSQCRDVFCPKPTDFHSTDLWARRDEKLKADNANAPQHLVDSLLSADMKTDGAAWISYLMPSGWPEEWVVRTPRMRREHEQKTVSLSDGPKVAHYLRFSLQCRVPIPTRFTVDMAERFRSAANSYIDAGMGSYALLGKPERLEAQHRHAFYLSMAGDKSYPGMLTDLHIWCPFGFTRGEVDILLCVRRLRWGSGRYPANPVLVAMGMEPPDGVPIATERRNLISRVWRSVTPFVPPLHFYRGRKDNPKVKSNAMPERQLVDCLRRAGIKEAVLVKRLQPSTTETYALVNSNTVSPMHAWEIVRAPEGIELRGEAFNNAVETRTHHNSSDTSGRPHERRVGFLLELEFEKPVALPMPSWGHSSHFGLGVFVPVNS